MVLHAVAMLHCNDGNREVILYDSSEKRHIGQSSGLRCVEFLAQKSSNCMMHPRGSAQDGVRNCRRYLPP